MLNEQQWWGRYPEFLKLDIRTTASPSRLHKSYLSDDYFPVLGSSPRFFKSKNRRRLDVNVARFENDADKKVDRTEWGLPVPNREAAYISLAKYAKDVLVLTPEQVFALNTSFDWTEKHFGPYMQNSKVKTQEEVIDGLDKSTSPGFPWTQKYATKRMLLDDWPGFKQYMENDWVLLQDPCYVAVFGNALKEEIRPRVKIDANSIRTFTAGPIEMTIMGNMLFEDMNEKFYASHLKSASVVGFTPLKRGWDDLYRKLRVHPNGFALDESQYDSSLRSYLMWACAIFRWNMLRPEDQTPDNLERLKNYYRNLVNTLIITSDGVFVFKKGGNPSGSVNTITDNTLILFMLLAYAWIMIVPDELLGYDKFMQHLSLCLCGDDNTWTVSDTALPFFNARSVIAVWAALGVTTTTDCVDPRPVEQLDFLSAHTVFVDGVAVPLYNRDKLLTSLLYSQEPGNPSYTLVRAAAMLRVGWTDVQLRNYCREFISWLVKHYDSVLIGTEEWRVAKSQIPTENELKTLYLGHESRLVFQVKQSFAGINLLREMSTLILPQRPRRVRKRKQPQVKKELVVVRPRRRNARRQRKPRVRRRRGGERPRNNRNTRGAPGMFPTSRSSMMNKKTCVVEQDEYIAEVFGNNNANSPTVESYSINPGQVGTFPWLSIQAAQWESYRFEMLEFYYHPEVSGFATEGQTGKVLMGIDYDAGDAPPATKQQILDTWPHDDGMPYESLIVKADPKELLYGSPGDTKFVRPGPLPGRSDVKTYDGGTLNVMTYNNNGTDAVGELHVRYRVRFVTPVLESGKAPFIQSVGYVEDGGPLSLTSTVPGIAFAGTTPSVNTGFVNLGLTLNSTTGTITMPAGNYLVSIGTTFKSTVGTAFMQYQSSLQIGGVNQTYGSYAPASTSWTGNSGAQFGLINYTFMFTAAAGTTLNIQPVCTSTSGTLTAASWMSIMSV